MQGLGSEGSKCMQVIEEKLQEGKLNLSQLATAQRVFLHQKTKCPTQKQKLEVLKSFEGLPHRQCEKEAARLTGSQVPAREKWTSGSGEDVRLSVTLDHETRALLDRFKELTAHQNPTASTAEAIKLALKVAITIKDPALNPPKRSSEKKSTAGKKMKNLKSNNRIARQHIGKDLKHKLWTENSKGCAWVDPHTKRRCGSRFKVQIDHIRPVSRNGETEYENLQLLCAAHNHFKSNKMLKEDRTSCFDT